MKFKLFATLAFVFLVLSNLYAQAPAYQQLRFEEDWSFLRDQSKQSDIFDPVKYIKLTDEGSYLSLGGEIRERYEGFAHSGFGAGPQDPNGYLLQRFLFLADAHAGKHVRLFAQFQSGLSNGRTGGPRPTDEDKGEVHQAFVDFKFGLEQKHTATLRIGRQEFEFGSGRLISASELLNVRRGFDGFRLSAQLGNWTIHSIAAHPAQVNPGAFDDKDDHTQSVWGVGVVHPIPNIKGGTFSLYYIGFDRKLGVFDSGLGPELRQTLGSRLFGTHANWDYNYELIGQWGTFKNNQPIRAWAISTDSGRSFKTAPLKPRLGVKTDMGSGDHNANDTTLHTFNPLFPSTAYSGKIGLLGPQNIIDVEPGVRLAITPRITTTAEWGVFWRESLHDGIYGISLSPFKTGQRSQSRYVANQPDLQLAFAVDRHLTIVGILTQFRTGAFIVDTPPSKNVGYATVYFTYRF